MSKRERCALVMYAKSVQKIKKSEPPFFEPPPCHVEVGNRQTCFFYVSFGMCNIETPKSQNPVDER